MHIKQALIAFSNQKSGAKCRGIAFNLTFKQWCDFWGDDIDRRGCGPDQLQMQRFCDTGPYEIGNICKGTPKQNSKTAANLSRKRAAIAGYADVQASLDCAMSEESRPEWDFGDVEPDIHAMRMKSSYSLRYTAQS